MEDLSIIRRSKATGGIFITAYNGALIYDCVQDKVLLENRVPLVTAQKVFDKAMEKNIHIHTYADNIIVSVAENKELEFYRKNIVLPYIIEKELQKVVENSVYKLITIELEDKSILEGFRDEIENSELGSEFTCTFSNDKYLELYSQKAGKGKSLVSLCNMLNIPVEDSVAAGDEENDKEMVMMAGVGVAMSNGNSNLKKIADYVTENDNNNDAIGEVIERFFVDNN